MLYEVITGPHHHDARGLQGGDLRLGRSAAATDDGPGMSHPLPGWRGHTGDIGGHRLADIRLDVVGGALLVSTADFTD